MEQILSFKSSLQWEGRQIFLYRIKSPGMYSFLFISGQKSLKIQTKFSFDSHSRMILTQLNMPRVTDPKWKVIDFDIVIGFTFIDVHVNQNAIYMSHVFLFFFCLVFHFQVKHCFYS